MVALCLPTVLTSIFRRRVGTVHLHVAHLPALPPCPFNTAFLNAAPLGMRGGGGGPTPPPPPSWSAPLSDWAKNFPGPLGNQNFSLAPLAPVSLGQKVSSAPLKTQHHGGGGGIWGDEELDLGRT